MPKHLVLHSGRSAATVSLADAVADGIRSVRFAEVDVRLAGASVEGVRHRPLEGPEALAGYEAIVLVAADAADAATLTPVLGQVAATMANRVGSVVAPPGVAGLGPVLESLGALGMILVTPVDCDVAAHGARVVKVTGWIAHAKSHEPGHGHSHGHSHGHHHHH